MADVILHEYVEQMRAHMQARRLSDASTLGQHILHYYPKHIETYVILARVSLEADDMAAATDLFRRVLSADPENVIALAGLALIHENQDGNAEAVWYLERAYEIEPTNEILRRELLRVLESYYGTRSEQLELTPGALARIHARRGQYAAAINEFRRLLRHESKRYDARVAFAETLYRAGRADEAAQLAQDILQDAPYSLKPNLILGALWSENAIADGQQYLARALALDPEQRVARDLIGARFAEVPPPHLPALQDQFVGARPNVQTEGFVPGEPNAPEHEGQSKTYANGTELLWVPNDISEKLRAIEIETQKLTSQIAAPEKPDILVDAAAASAVTTHTIITAQETEPADTDPSPETSDPTLTEVAAPPAGSKIDSIPAEASAAAFATDIALNRSKQPAPTRRTHPALPKVRPFIRGASDKLPSWLRLSATAAQTSASFEAPAPTQVERIVPIVTPETQATPDERPDWLVQAQAPDTTAAASDTELPDWLRTATALDLAKKPVTTTPPETINIPPTETPVKPAAPEMPDWLRDPNAPKAETSATAAIMPQTAEPETPTWRRETKSETPTTPTLTLSDPNDAGITPQENAPPTLTET